MHVEARLQETSPIPTQGGTGLEISTWLGDLGGGAGMIAYRRVANPTISAMSVFRGSHFGDAVNLEGDVAGCPVARNTTATSVSDPSAPVFPTSSIADTLETYLAPSGSRAEWNSRCSNFLQMLGGQLDSSGRLTNRSTLVASLADQIEGFRSWYLVNRLCQQGRLTLTMLREASRHITGASNEVAQIFVDALNYCSNSSGGRLEARGAAPLPSPPGEASRIVRALIEGSGFLEGVGREGRSTFNRVREWWDKH